MGRFFANFAYNSLLPRVSGAIILLGCLKGDHLSLKGLSISKNRALALCPGYPKILRIKKYLERMIC